VTKFVLVTLFVVGEKSSCPDVRGGLGRLAAWHLPGGPVGPPRRMLKERVEWGRRLKGP